MRNKTRQGIPKNLVSVDAQTGTIGLEKLSNDKDYEIRVLGQYFPKSGRVTELFSASGEQLYDHLNEPVSFRVERVEDPIDPENPDSP